MLHTLLKGAASLGLTEITYTHMYVSECLTSQSHTDTQTHRGQCGVLTVYTSVKRGVSLCAYPVALFTV